MTKETKYVETPLMKQYYTIKEKHPDAILLFRVGDFYETFGQDAILASRLLGITLTKRANVELAGFPYHALDTYLPKLIRAGERVAICEQLEDPKTTKKIVKRGVIELITPGVSFNDNIIPSKENVYLAAIYFGKKNIGISLLDVTTGEFLLAEGDQAYIDKLLVSFKPKEILYQRGCKDQMVNSFGEKHYLYHLEQWIFSESSARSRLLTQLGVTTLKGYGIETLCDGIIAAGAILYYLEFTQHKQTSHINTITRIVEDRYVWLDKYSINNLEIFTGNDPAARCFIDIIDHTASPMGGRMLRRWVSLPLKEIQALEERYDVVDFLLEDTETASFIHSQLSLLGDMERLVSKIAMARINPREVLTLKRALKAIKNIQDCLLACNSPILRRWAEELVECRRICERIEQTILAEPAIAVNKGAVIKSGVSAELDDLRKISSGGKEYLNRLLQQEIERTGISSLKISFNNVFGYYIEVRNLHKDKVPSQWIRKQTLANAERYITAELKEYEEKILGAEERIMALENSIYGSLIIELSAYTPTIQKNAALAARIDVLHAFASCAQTYSYIRPTLSQERKLDIKQGRHPVIETQLADGEPYIANDLYLDDQSQQIIIVTGPNMSGKSALLRQTALIVLMAQIGSFVPASGANIGLVDKIFTRVGASDNISRGESTFMVEMLESANILNNTTDKSLVLLDEIGRGTSTYDGMSIAWAMVEYLHENAQRHARTLFATHYHELNELTEHYARVKNFNVQVKEINNRVIFLRKLVPGGTEHSFGIHVARMAGMPKSVVRRAEQILATLEAKARREQDATQEPKQQTFTHLNEYKETIKDEANGLQMSLFQLDDPLLYQIRDAIKGIDIDNLTPLNALNKLSEIKKLLGV